jgi:16S rRNA (uracil1498-N3)-methyltransferase
MRVSRVFVDAPLSPGARLMLPRAAAGHVMRVLRLKAGAALTLFNGAGGEYSATLEAEQRGAVAVSVGEARAVARESALHITLVQGVSRGERMDLVVQKVTELGVTQLVPVISERSVVRLDEAQAARRLAHWRAIAIGACEQSGRNTLPTLLAPLPLAQLLRTGTSGAASKLLLSGAAQLRLQELPRPAGEIMVLIGPEGGLTPEEQAQAGAAGFVGVRLGPRVLRTETAAIAAVALLQQLFGDL